MNGNTWVSSSSSLAAVAAVALALSIGARPAPAQGIGLRGGLNLADFVGSGAPEGESSVGLNAGGSFQLLSFGPVSVGPEVYYAQKGTKRSQVSLPDGGTTTFSSEFNLAYVEVPLLVTVHPLGRGGGSPIKPYVHAGPVFGWNLDCSIELSDPQASPEETCASLLGGSLESTFQDYEQGITFGGGLNLVLVPGKGSITLDVRTTRGLADVISTGSGETLEIRNRTYSAMLGYSFGL